MQANLKEAWEEHAELIEHLREIELSRAITVENIEENLSLSATRLLPYLNVGYPRESKNISTSVTTGGKGIWQFYQNDSERFALDASGTFWIKRLMEREKQKMVTGGISALMIAIGILCLDIIDTGLSEGTLSILVGVIAGLAWGSGLILVLITILLVLLKDARVNLWGSYKEVSKFKDRTAIYETLTPIVFSTLERARSEVKHELDISLKEKEESLELKRKLSLSA